MTVSETVMRYNHFHHKGEEDKSEFILRPDLPTSEYEETDEEDEWFRTTSRRKLQIWEVDAKKKAWIRDQLKDDRYI